MSRTAPHPAASSQSSAHAHSEVKARGQKRRFLMEFIRKPGQIGSVIPSSRHLSKRIVDLADLSTAKVVVEYGPGTGPITGFIRKGLAPGASFFAIELSPSLAQLLRERHPGVKVHEGSAGDVDRFLQLEGLKTAAQGGGIDVVISGIPWTTLPGPVCRSIIEATAKALRPGGKFLTFGYTIGLVTPAGKRFHRLLPTVFSKVERSEVVWRNVPPAFVAVCTR